MSARDELGIDMHDALLIGDNINDIQAALAARVQPILVLTGLGMRHLREHSHEADGTFHVAMSLQHFAEMTLRGFTDAGREKSATTQKFRECTYNLSENWW